MQKSSKLSKTSMFSDIQELKEFLEWSKKQGIQTVKVQDIEVSFSPLAMLPADTYKEMQNLEASTLAELDPNQDKEDDEILFHSSSL